MALFHSKIYYLLALLAIHASFSPAGAKAKEIKKFKSIPIRIEDSFQKDSRKDYKITGDVTWDLLEMSLKPNGALTRIETLDPDFRYEVDIWTDELAPGEQSVSRINLHFTNRWIIVITIVRGTQNGQILCQTIISEIDGRDPSAKKPKIAELHRSRPFALSEDLERWSLRYNNGLLDLRCNNQKMGTCYTQAFSSWLNVVSLAQVSHEIIVSRLLLSGRSVGYSKQQREFYNRITELRQRSAKEASVGDFDQSIKTEEGAIQLVEQAFGDNDFSLGLIHQSIAERFGVLRQYTKAKEAYERSSTFFKHAFGEHHPQTLLNDIYIAEQLMNEGRLDDAETAMKPALYEFVRIVGMKGKLSQTIMTRLVTLLKLQGNAHFKRGEYRLAQKNWQELVGVYVKFFGADYWATQEAQIRLKFATRVLNSQGQELAQLTKYLQQKSESELLLQQGKISLLVAKRKALLPIARSLFGNLHPEIAQLLLALSIDTFNVGEVDLSISMLKEGMSIYRGISGEKSPAYILGLGLLGSQLSMLHRYSEAGPILERACELSVEHGLDNSTEYARIKLELGRHLIRVGNLKEAAKHLAESLQLYNSLGAAASIDALKASERLCNIFRSAGKMAEAEWYLNYQRKIVLASYGTKSVPYIDILTVEAKHLYLRKKYRQAMKKYDDAATLIESIYGKNSRSYEVVIEGMIEVSLAINDMPTVVKYFEELLELELYRRESLFKVYTESEQIVRSVRDLFSLDALLVLALEGHLDARRAYNHAMAFKGAVTAKQRSTHIAAQDPTMSRLLGELTRIELQLSPSNTENRTVQEKEEYHSLTQKRDDIRARLQKMSASFETASNRTKISDLKRVLPDNTVLIDYFEYLQPKSYFEQFFRQHAKIGMIAFVINSDGDVHLVDLGSVAEITDAWTAWREAMDAEPYYELTSPDLTLAELTDQRGAALRKLIWDPLAEHIKEADTVVVSPSLHLVACPFSALPSKEKGQFLIERFAFATLTTPRLLPELLADRKEEKTVRMLLVRDIDFDVLTSSKDFKKPPSTADQSQQFFTRIPNANSEFGSIRDSFVDRFNTQGLVELHGEQASEAKVRRQIVGSQYVLIDTHGFCLPQDEIERMKGSDVSTKTIKSQNLESGIALANGNAGLLATDSSHEDGILWAKEIAELDLSAVNLITLSACQTALGELVPGEGMLGAQRAIHVAGARSSLTTLWSVESHSTKNLLSKFYQQLWGQQLTKAKSLQQAKIFMLRKYNMDGKVEGNERSRSRTPPALWAGFVLHGDWR